MKKSHLAGSAIALLWLLASVALAQSTVGGVNGTVRDQANAVVPGASVILLETDKNITRHVESDSAGLYNFLNVPPGHYQLTAGKEGFRKWSGRLDLQVQQIAVIDPLLKVGDVASVVEVTAVTPVIAAESSSIGTVTEAAAIRELPLNGRDVSLLFQLTPGVQVSDSPRVNGLKSGGAEMLQDGGSIVSRWSGGLPRITPGLDTIQEFNIDMNSSAQFSRPATVTMVTRSGTNQLHGALFETFRNNSAGLRARARADGNTSSRYIRNEFGASAGGPIRLPKLYNGTDKTFWFFSYEGGRLRQQSTAATFVPTQAMWDGDYSNLVDAQGKHYTIYDPSTTTTDGKRLPFAGNTIPSSVQKNQLYTYLMDHTSRPTNSTNPYAGTNWLGTASKPHTMNTFTGKLDHHLSQRDTISGRFTISDSDSYGYLGYGPVAPDLSYNYRRDLTHLYSGTINYTRAFSPTVVNELMLSGQRSGNMQGGGREDVRWDAQLGLTNPLAEYGWPTLDARNGPGNNFMWDSENKNPEFLNTLIPEDNLTMVRGKHEIKMGFRFRNERNNTRGVQMGQGRYGFGQGWTALYDVATDSRVDYTGDGLASMRLGYGRYYKIQYNRPYYYLRQSEMGSYVQDAWRATPRLTLNYGLRWDYWTPYSEASHRVYNMDMSQWQTTHQLITPAGHASETLGLPPSLLQSYARGGMTWTTADKAGFPAQLQNSDRRDFAPRIGVAFKLDDKTVLRGGYGIYYWTVPLSQMLGEQGYSAPLRLSYEASIDYWNQINDYDWFHQPIPGERMGDPNIVDINGAQSVQAPFGFVPFAKDWRNARAQEWNFTIEREIMPMTRLRVSYIGNHGSQLEQTATLNSQQSEYLYVSRTGQPLPDNRETLRVNPFWQTLNLRTPIGYSNSNSLQVAFERRAYKGLEFQSYWVFSRNLSTADSDGYASQPGAYVPDAVVLPNPGTQSDRLKLVYSNVASVPKHQVNWHLMYDLPFGHGKAVGGHVSGVLNQVIGNWQIKTIGGFRTGTWLTPGDPNNPWNPWTNYFLNGDPRLSASQRRVINFSGRQQLLYFRGNFDPTGTGLQSYQPGIAKPGPEQDGYVPLTLADGSSYRARYDVYNPMPSNFIEGPKNWNMDLAIWKNFKLSESKSLRFSADFFNVLNHPNNNDPDMITGLIDLSQQANDPRIIQFSLRFQF